MLVETRKEWRSSGVQKLKKENPVGNERRSDYTLHPHQREVTLLDETRNRHSSSGKEVNTGYPACSKKKKITAY
jgi:hypothetical protein